jgi:uncharacterized SAM-binding protein YcdF (DUF218 family)
MISLVIPLVTRAKFLQRLWLRASGLFTLFLVLITFTPFVNWYAGWLGAPWTDPDGDVLIVLGGGSLDGRFPSENTLLRCLYAVRAYQRGHFREVLVVGFEISQSMRDVLASQGIPAAVIRLEDRSMSTRENAIRTAGLLNSGSGRKVLLTSDYHMLRAARAFRKAGVTVAEYPVPDARKRSVRYLKRASAFEDEALETVKIVYYFLHGWI